MGADGGTIATRSDMVRTKDLDERPDYDAGERRHALWTLCRLSKHPLEAPVMADALGQLYNKDSLLEYLLKRGAAGASETEQRVAGHIRGLRDATSITLTKNPAPQRDEDGTQYYPYACPLTGRPMNGKHNFVYLRCGCVFSETGLRNVAAPKKGNDERAECPQCSAPFSAVFEPRDIECDITWINPSPETQSIRRDLLATRKKRKARTDDKARDSRARPARPARPAKATGDDHDHGHEHAPDATSAESVHAAQTQTAENPKEPTVHTG
ncbi:Replication termination factor 2 [Malassezia cuniculi]|uniref:Replication termination factor 2 n=1 Tax=Malassezia cuniculi TaxID=948313 RepID=A0AAF0ESS5_9BASI|nr:Replication termination factor 2 [Malassezia cuniculi]